MISLVTQSDGSARRVPWIALALSAAMVAGFASTFEQMTAAQARADAAMSEAVQTLRDNPYLTLPDALEPFLSASSARKLRHDYETERKELGIRSAIPEAVLRRTQMRFDQEVQDAFALQAVLPAAKHGFRSAEDPPERYFEHAFFHATVLAFGLALGVLLLVGIPLEDVWGPLPFALFVAGALPLGAAVFDSFHAGTVGPWLGGGGLAAALLGASAFRWLSVGSPRFLGGLPLPAWLLLPGWIAAEYVGVRGLTHETWQAAPWIAHASLLGFGFSAALLFRVVGIEARLGDRWRDTADDMHNVVYEKAMALREKGKREAALQLLEKEFEREPTAVVATAVWDVARDLGDSGRGAAAAMWALGDALKRGQAKVVARQWSEISEWAPSVEIEPTFCVKLADALLREGERDAAGEVLERAARAATPMGGKIALRAVRMAAKVDHSLARRVAERALANSDLSDKERSDLQAQLRKFPGLLAPELSAVGERKARRGDTSETLPSTRARLDGFAALKAAPRDEVVDGVPAAPARPAASAATDDPFDMNGLDAAALDPRALDPDALDAGGSGGDDALEDEFDRQAFAAAEDGSAIDPNALDPSALGGDEGAAESAAEGRAVDPESWNSPGVVDGLDDGEDGPVPDPFLDDFGDDAALDEAVAALRPLRVVGAVPLALTEDSIQLDTEGRGKSRLRFDRIEAIAVGAVRGLGSKPVVVVDLAVNWLGAPDEPLRVLRLRSDRFDPRRLVPQAANGVAALRALVAKLVDGSNATCLPDAESVRGEPFAVYADLETYHRDALRGQ